MKPSTELFNLIKSLSKSEKRFFKLSSSLQSGEKNYLKIFDAIERQEGYDEEEIKDQFGDETFIKHFPSEKNHLYKLILKSLRSYHSDNSVNSLLKQEIKNIEILYKKALFRECNKFLKRAVKQAVLNEKFYYLFELISWEKILLEEAFESGDFNNDLDNLIVEEHDCIAKLKNLAEYQILYSKINYIFRIGGFVKSDEEKGMVDEISRHHLIVNEDAPLSIRAESVRYYVKGFCSNAYRDYETSLKNFEKVKDLLDEHPHLRKDLGKRYLRSLINIIMGYLNKKNFKKAKELTEELETIQSKPGFNTLDIQFMVFSAQYIAKLVLLIRTGEFEEGVKLIPQISEELESDRKVNKEQKLIFYYIISYIYFGAERYKEALQWINKVLNDNENTLRQDIYSYARIFNLVIHYELGNYDLLEYIIKSTNRYLNKKDREYKIETLLIEYIKRFSKLPEGDQKQKLYIELREELDEHFKESSERVILEYFDFKAWILAKIDGVGFREMVIRRNIHKA